MTITIDASICATHGAYGGPGCPVCSLANGLPAGSVHVGPGSRMRLRCGRCGHTRDHVVGEPLPPCPGACGATENSIACVGQVNGLGDALPDPPAGDKG